MSAKRKLPPAKAPNISQLARDYGVSRETLRSWRNQGTDLSNKRAVAERIKTMRATVGEAGGSGVETYSEARRRRAIADANRAEIIAEREAGISIDVGTVIAEARLFGLLTRTRFTVLANTLPDRLAGCDAVSIHRTLKKEIRDTLEALASEQLGERHLQELEANAEKHRKRNESK